MTLTITIDGSDVTDAVRLDSLALAMQAIKGQVGAGSFLIDDTSGTDKPAPAAKEWSVEESDASPTVIAGGFVAERDLDRGPLRAGVQRQFRPVLEDWNTVLTDRVLKNAAANRPEETDVKRVRWLLGTGSMGMLDGNGRGHVPNDRTTTMDATDYRGKTPLDVLDDCAEAANKNFYVYYKNATSGWRLYYDATNATEAAFTSDLSISDDPADIDDVTTFGASRISYRKDPERVRSHITVQYAGGWVSRRDTGTSAEFRNLQRSVVKKNIKTRAKARTWADKQLERFDDETTQVGLTVSVPGSKLGELRAGMRIQVKLRSRGITALTYFRITGALFSRRAGRRGVSDVEYDVRLTLKDKVRPVNTSDDIGGGDGGGRSDTGGGGNDPEGSSANTGPYDLIGFETDTSPPTMSNGDSISAVISDGEIRQGRTHDGTEFGPTWSGGTGIHLVGSYLGEWYYAWTAAVNPCTQFDNMFTGYTEIEEWYYFTMPAHPASMAGINITFTAGDSGNWQGPGQGETAPLDIVTLDSQPDEMRLGSVIGQVSASSSNTVMVPGALLPVAGSNLYIGYRTSWETTAKYDDSAYACGWTWPRWSDAYQTDAAGISYIGTSGDVAVSTPTTPVWRVWDASAADLGIATIASGAPWAGSNTIYDAGYGGAGDGWSFTDGAFTVGSNTPVGKGIYMVGGEEDDGQPDGPWSGGAWAHEYTFEVSAHGSITDAGTRSIESTTLSGGVNAVGTVHLGDSSRAEGISVKAPTTEVYLAKALTTGVKWAAKFDSRPGVFRGKLWKVSDGEPANWDVQTPITTQESTEDRWALWLRAGNVGTSQTVKVHDVRAFGVASSGQRIEKEWLGFADGSTSTFKVAHKFREGTLLFHTNGLGVAPTGIADAAADIDFYPTDHSIIRASYVVD